MCNTDVKSGTEMYAKFYPETSSDGVNECPFCRSQHCKLPSFCLPCLPDVGSATGKHSSGLYR